MAEIFRITHESNDLSEYSSTTTDGGDLSTSAAAAMVGSFGLSFLIDDTNLIEGQKNFTQITSAVYRYRVYFDPNALTMSSGDFFTSVQIREGGNARGNIQVEFDGADYRIRAQVRDDATTRSTSYYVISDATHYIEARVQYAASAVSADGDLTLWIDGTLKETLGSLDIFDISKPDKAILRADGIDAGTSGTFYQDDFIFRDDDTEIGGAAGTVTVSVSDTISVSESVSAANILLVSISDTVSVSESVSRANILFIPVSESISVAEAAGFQIGSAVIANQLQGPNLGADLYNGTIL